MISPEGEVAFDLELTTPACPVKEEFRKSCDDYLRKLSWVRNTCDLVTRIVPRIFGFRVLGQGLRLGGEESCDVCLRKLPVFFFSTLKPRVE